MTNELKHERLTFANVELDNYATTHYHGQPTFFDDHELFKEWTEAGWRLVTCEAKHFKGSGDMPKIRISAVFKKTLRTL